MSKIYLNPDEDLVREIRRALADNDFYCPCVTVKSRDTKCMCKEFREMKSGECHCGLYIKEE